MSIFLNGALYVPCNLNQGRVVAEGAIITGRTLQERDPRMFDRMMMNASSLNNSALHVVLESRFFDPLFA